MKYPELYGGVDKRSVKKMYLSPMWFYWYEIILEMIFAVISLIISIFAFRIFRMSDNRPAKLLSFSFFFIFLSYLVQSSSNLITSNLNISFCGLVGLCATPLIDSIGLYLHIFFMMIGLIMLTYMAMKTRRKMPLWVLLIVTMVALLFSNDMIMTYYLLSAIYLAIVTWHYIRNYLSNRQTKTLIVAIAFVFLFFGSFHFLISVNHQIFYIIGNFLGLIAYICILINYYLVLKK